MKASNGFCQVKEVEIKGIQYGDTFLRVGEIITLGKPPALDIEPWPFRMGDQVLFDTNKSLKHGTFWYLKAQDVIAYDENTAR